MKTILLNNGVIIEIVGCKYYIAIVMKLSVKDHYNSFLYSG